MIAGVPDAAALAAALREIAEYIDEGGLDGPGILGSAVVFALVETTVLARAEPGLAAVLADGGPLTPVQQHPDDTDSGVADLERYLATTRWPKTVAGSAIVQNILVVPPGEAHSPAAFETTVDHDRGRPAQLFVGVLRSGSTLAFLRVLGESEMRTTEDLAGALIEAIRSTFTDS
ncbi:PPA1309 family protein [Millisia brevis]|uniref:PPA1309 family protein n=1 Tax=Millisia brevis TaxID=264148 RepID=UPI00157C9841|nr:PPA1309 family protein [Millisia brevis]